MSLPELQCRNNDPSENVQFDYTDLSGHPRVLSFVATRSHWCAELNIYGDLFAAPLEAVLDGDAYPVRAGSPDEEHLINLFRQFVHTVIPEEERRFLHQILLGKAHRSDKTHDQIRARRLVWFLSALERRRQRHMHESSSPRALDERNLP